MRGHMERKRACGFSREHAFLFQSCRRNSLLHNPNGHLLTGSRNIHAHEYVFHRMLSVVMVLPFLSSECMMAMTSSMSAFSVILMLPSPRRVSWFPFRCIILCIRYSPLLSRTRATHPLRRSESFHGPSVMLSLRSTIIGFMLFPLTVRLTVLPSETNVLISSIITALSMVIFLGIACLSIAPQN